LVASSTSRSDPVAVDMVVMGGSATGDPTPSAHPPRSLPGRLIVKAGPAAARAGTVTYTYLTTSPWSA
jgi:hypothetical protein